MGSLSVTNAEGGPISTLLGRPSLSRALIAADDKEPFHLSPLPYSYEALEPIIDHELLYRHHAIHHRQCVEKLNAALQGVPVKGLSLEEILAHVSDYPEAVRAAGGGHWNHTFFWSIMTDAKEDHELPPAVLLVLEENFGSLERFKEAFVRAGVEHTGSGWVWLLKTSSGRLIITATSNHDSPLMEGCEPTGVPLLVCDLWEHAYETKYHGRREDFLRKFLTIANWARVQVLLSGELH